MKEDLLKNFEEKAFSWLDKSELPYTIWNNKYRKHDETFDQWLTRVSSGDLIVQKLIKEKKFIFAGRTLSNRNIKDGSYSNCYSRGYIKDNIQDILQANTDIALTYKAQGGEGLSLSLIRPKGTPIGKHYFSDGIIPFMRMYDTTTSTIMQGGHRRGALLISLDIWHKEAPEFISVKSDLGEINNANLSLEIDDEFMSWVDHYYQTGEEKTILVEREYGKHKVSYEVCPIKLYKHLCAHSHKFAEPGVLFTNKLRNYNIMEYCDDYQIETCNPCSEQPLPPHGACCLSSINLEKYVINPYTQVSKIDYDSLAKDIPIIVKAMNDIVDEGINLHALKEQQEIARKYRNIGIGIMGLADMFVQLKVNYNSTEACVIAENLMKFIFRHTTIASVELAKKDGNFPGYSSKVWDSTIMNNSFSKEELEDLKKTNKLRNCSLLSVAPTGSIGTMFNVSTGVEPFFQLKYVRRTESLNKEETFYDVYIKAALNYKEITKEENLPDYFVSSEDISWENRVSIQAALQKFTDTAISSTINLSKDTPIETIEKIYLESWKQGLKGITVYREGSRIAILSKAVEKPIKLDTRKAPKRPEKLEAEYHQIKAKGETFIVLVGLYEGKPYELFAFRPLNTVNIPVHKGVITKIKKMYYTFDSPHIQISNLELANENIEEKAATLYTSHLLRHGVEIKHIVKTAKKVNDNISSFSSAMCRTLSKYIPDEVLEDLCPECGKKLIREGGCIHCIDCTYSKCD